MLPKTLVSYLGSVSLNASDYDSDYNSVASENQPLESGPARAKSQEDTGRLMSGHC